MIERQAIRQDLFWAGFILLLALVSGLLHQWQLVQLSWTGKLPAYLETEREKKVKAALSGMKTLNLAQAYEIFQKGQALFIDARSPEDYAEIHISGAVNLPREELDKIDPASLPNVPADRLLVVYCSTLSCDAALVVAEKLQSLGYTEVSVFMGGFRAWDEAGYPAETSK